MVSRPRLVSTLRAPGAELFLSKVQTFSQVVAFESDASGFVLYGKPISSQALDLLAETIYFFVLRAGVRRSWAGTGCSIPQSFD